MRERIQLVLAFLAIVTLVSAAPASATSSVVHDPSADTLAEPYTDIMMSKVTAQSGRDVLYFQTVLAGAVPATPTRPGRYNGFTAYNWLIDTDGNGLANYVVVVRFCSHLIQGPCIGDDWHWEGALTAALTGQRLGSFDFAIEDNVVKGFVATSQLGNADAFRWIAAARTSPSSSNLPSSDLAPDLAGDGTPVWAEFAR
jgi:hypothetical protein